MLKTAKISLEQLMRETNKTLIIWNRQLVNLQIMSSFIFICLITKLLFNNIRWANKRFKIPKMLPSKMTKTFCKVLCLKDLHLQFKPKHQLLLVRKRNSSCKNFFRKYLK